jgi:hypothetical protein
MDDFQRQVAKIIADVDAAHPEYRRPPEAIPLWLIINAKVNNDCELLTALSVARLIDELRRESHHTSVTLLREENMTASLRQFGHLLIRVLRRDEQLVRHDLLRAVLDAPATAGQDVVHVRAEMPLLRPVVRRDLDEELGPLTAYTAVEAYRRLSGDTTSDVALELVAAGWFEGLSATILERQLLANRK